MFTKPPSSSPTTLPNCASLLSSQYFLSTSPGQGTKLGHEGSKPFLQEALPECRHSRCCLLCIQAGYS